MNKSKEALIQRLNEMESVTTDPVGFVSLIEQLRSAADEESSRH